MDLLVVLGPTLLIVVASAIRRDPRRRREDLRTLLAWWLYVFCGTLLQLYLVHHNSPTHDSELLAVDSWLGFPTLAVWHWASSKLIVRETMRFIYLMLCPMMAVAWIVEQRSVLRTSLILGGMLAFIGYGLLPAVGPTVWTTGIPYSVAPRNCLPSMHLTWAALLALNCRKPWLRWTFYVFAVLTACATIACGEHYLLDLLAAFPYTLFVLYASQKIGSKYAVPRLQQVRVNVIARA